MVGQDVVAPLAVVAAALQRGLAAPERAAVDFRMGTGIGESVLGLDQDRSAQGVQAEHRIGAGHQRHARHRLFRDQVPVDRVAENFVDAHAVHVHGNAFRSAKQGRGRETVVLDVGLQRIVLGRIDRDPGHVPVHVVGDIKRLRTLEIAGCRGLHAIGQQIFGQIGALLRRHGDHVDRRKLRRVLAGRIVRRFRTGRICRTREQRQCQRPRDPKPPPRCRCDL